MAVWPRDPESLDAEQRRLASLEPELWHPAAGVVRAAAVFLAFARGQEGPGRAGDRGWSSAVLMELPGLCVLDRTVVPAVAGAAYDPGRLASRAGPALEAALAGLSSIPEVVFVDATGRDHPRGAGLALHLGAELDVPSVGVTHRPLIARGSWPPDEPGAWTPLLLDTEVVGAWLRTRAGARPLAIHAAWRTDVSTAVEVVRLGSSGARTPEPLRSARRLARTARHSLTGPEP